MAENKNDKEFGGIMQDFAKSLNLLVKAMVNMVEENKDSSKDSLAATKEQAAAITEMAQELKVVSETTAATKSTTERILDIVKGIKREKKTGMWETLGKGKDKTKGVADGIKTISLMAGAILAIGTAFKVVGDVDFASVVALSVALPLIATAVNKIGESDLTPKEMAIISLNMVIMSAGLAASSYILSLTPDISLPKLVSIIGVSVGMGIAMYALAEAGDNVGKNVGNVLIMAAALPLVAGGIYLSALILENTPNLDMMNILKATISVAGAAVIMGGVTWVFDKLGVTPVTALKGALSVTIVAGAIAMSSQLLALGDYSNVPDIKWALGAGASVLGFGMATAALGLIVMTGIGAVGMLAGATAVIGLSATISAASHILNTGDYSNYPTLGWSSGVGLSLLAFGLAAVPLGVASVLPGFKQGLEVPKQVAQAIVDTAMVFSDNTAAFKGGPSPAWALGAGAAIAAFGIAAVPLGIASKLPGFEAGLKVPSLVAQAIVDAAKVFNGNTAAFTGGPGEAWAKGVGLSLSAFGNAIGKFSSSLFGDSLDEKIDALPRIAKAIITVAGIFNDNTAAFTGGPDETWAKGVGLSISLFGNAIGKFESSLFGDSMTEKIDALYPLARAIAYFGTILGGREFKTYPSTEWTKGVANFVSTFAKLDIVKDADKNARQLANLSRSYGLLARSITALGESFQSIKEVPDLTGVYGGMVTLSLVDSGNLSSTLDMLNTKQNQFQKVMGMIQAQSDVRVDESTFAFNKDRKSPDKKDAVGVGQSVTPVTPIVTAQPKPVANQQQANTKTDELLNKLVNLISDAKSILGEIADNTGQKIHTDKSIISN
jgi:hypothetical protein